MKIFKIKLILKDVTHKINKNYAYNFSQLVFHLILKIHIFYNLI